MHRFRDEMLKLDACITYEIEVHSDHPAHSQFGKSKNSTSFNVAKAKSAPVKHKKVPAHLRMKEQKKPSSFRPAPYVSQQHMDMIYTMGAFSDSVMPVNMSFAQPA